jgi:hypothetical protein
MFTQQEKLLEFTLPMTQLDLSTIENVIVSMYPNEPGG